MNSGTPRTDAEFANQGYVMRLAMVEFARQLERELAEAKAEINATNEITLAVMKERDDAKAEIARLTECVKAGDVLRGMNRGVVDTDQVLDRCHECGELAKWMRRYDGAWGVECWACDNDSGWFDSQYKAIIEWNKQQREAK